MLILRVIYIFMCFVQFFTNAVKRIRSLLMCEMNFILLLSVLILK